jgi:TolB-like protein
VRDFDRNVADGIVEKIITALSPFHGAVRHRPQLEPHVQGAAVVKQVGRELGVGFVLEGSVRKAANRVRISGQLIDTTTGAHLWQIPNIRNKRALGFDKSDDRPKGRTPRSLT